MNIASEKTSELNKNIKNVTKLILDKYFNSLCKGPGFESHPRRFAGGSVSEDSGRYREYSAFKLCINIMFLLGSENSNW